MGHEALAFSCNKFAMKNVFTLQQIKRFKYNMMRFKADDPE